MILAFFSRFFANIAKFFAAKSAQASVAGAKTPQPMSSKIGTVMQTVRKQAYNSAIGSVTRAAPKLVVFDPEANTREERKFSKKLTGTTHVGRSSNQCQSLVKNSDHKIIIVRNDNLSKHHLSINLEERGNHKKYILSYKDTANGTFKREPIWASLLFWRHGSDCKVPMWIPFFNWKYKKLKTDVDLCDGDVLIIGPPGDIDKITKKITNPQLKFVYPPVWYIRLAILSAKGLLALILLFGLACWLMTRSVSDVIVNPLPNSPAPLAIFASNGKTLMAGGISTPHQEKKQLSEYPKFLVETLLQSEDKIFYFHPGLNPVRIVTTAIDNLIAKGITGGASTLTQQLARTLFQYEVNGKDMFGKKILYNQEEGTKDTLDRKIREAGLALRLTFTHSKNDILLAYMNSVDLGYRTTGERIRGFSDASNFYFAKPIEEFSDQDPEDIARIANMVSLLPAPVLADSMCYRRIELTNSERKEADNAAEEAKKKGKKIETKMESLRKDAIDLKEKRDGMIDRLRDRGLISANLAKDAKTRVNYNLFSNKNGFCQGSVASPDSYKYSPIFLTERTREEVRVALSISKQAEQEQGKGIFDNYIVLASLDVDKQDRAKRLITKSIERLWRQKGVPHGALITIDPKTGEILALVGEVQSLDGNTKYDYAATEEIPPASTFKLFFYTAALKGGLPLDRIYACDSLNFARQFFPVSDYSHYCAAGENAIDLKTAVALSDNLVPLKVAKEFSSLDQVVETARDMGINTPLDAKVPEMAYGQYRAILREMTGAYAILANQGKYNFPHAIREIYVNTNRGNCDSSAEKFRYCPRIYAYEKDVRAEKQVISAKVADQMTELLRGVVKFGTGRNADISAVINKDIAGKTGTSDGSQDGWFIGYIPDELVTGIWLGNFVQPALVTMPPPSQDFSSADAAQVWGDYMLSCSSLVGCK